MSSYHPEYTALLTRPEIVAELHAAGISVITFTVNDDADWERTDRPRRRRHHHRPAGVAAGVAAPPLTAQPSRPSGASGVSAAAAGTNRAMASRWCVCG